MAEYLRLRAQSFNVEEDPEVVPHVAYIELTPEVRKELKTHLAFVKELELRLDGFAEAKLEDDRVRYGFMQMPWRAEVRAYYDEEIDALFDSELQDPILLVESLEDTTERGGKLVESISEVSVMSSPRGVLWILHGNNDENLAVGYETERVPWDFIKDLP